MEHGTTIDGIVCGTLRHKESVLLNYIELGKKLFFFKRKLNFVLAWFFRNVAAGLIVISLLKLRPTFPSSLKRRIIFLLAPLIFY